MTAMSAIGPMRKSVRMLLAVSPNAEAKRAISIALRDWPFFVRAGPSKVVAIEAPVPGIETRIAAVDAAFGHGEEKRDADQRVDEEGQRQEDRQGHGRRESGQCADQDAEQHPDAHHQQGVQPESKRRAMDEQIPHRRKPPPRRRDTGCRARLERSSEKGKLG